MIIIGFIPVVLLVYFVVNTVLSRLFIIPSRPVSATSSLFNLGSSIFSDAKLLGLLCMGVFLTFIVVNLLGNVPGFAVPSLYYYFTCSVSLSLWVSLIISILTTQFRGFVSHMLPYGSPAALMLFLPLVEIFRQIIRPFTLMVRLSTNLSSGHIILYIFSFFSLSSFTLRVVLLAAVTVLILLELFISALQAYIFTSLTFLYISEGLPSSTE